MDRPVRLAIANDYEIVVRGLAAALEPHADRVQVAELTVDDDITPAADVVLYDVFGSGEVHTGDIRQVLDEGQHHVAVFTWNFDRHLIDLALGAGVRGYLSKGLGGSDLADAVVRIADGEVVVLEPTRRTEASVRRWPGQLHDLPEREAEVLALIAQGYDNDQIAERLYISVNTVKSRIRNLYRRMGFQNRVEAAVWAVKHGFEPDSGATAQSRHNRPL
jgi:two-component system, NarL family, response regulator LiaR